MGKRGNSEGSIYQRQDGRWVASGSYLAEDGTRKRKSWYGRTRSEAAEKLASGLHALQQGITPPNERLTVAAFLNRWLADTVEPHRRRSTYESYESYVRLHLIPALGTVPVARLKPQQVQAMIAAKQKSGLSPRTVQYIRAILRAALQRAVQWNLAPRNVAALTDSPRVSRAEVRPLTPTQAKEFLAGIAGDRFEALYVLAITTGLRQGELLGLRWDAVEIDRAELRVERTREAVSGPARFGDPKSASSRRVVSLSQRALDALKRHRVVQLEQRLAAGPSWSESNLVFTTYVGTPLNSSGTTHRFQKKLADLGLPKQRFHDLRHLNASLLLAAGASPRTVMGQLGHSQFNLTMTTYGHLVPEALKDAADRMDAILAS
ncbi:MAG: tyrosine recombinase XerC [Dehalococcoidia bacterium]